MKKLIDWILGLFKKQETEITFEAWPFPSVSEDFEPRPKPKTKPRVKKATTRPAKKAPAAIRTTAKKTVKKTVKKAK